MSDAKPKTAAARQYARQLAARERGDCGSCCKRPAAPGRFRCEQCEIARRPSRKRAYGPVKPRHMQEWHIALVARRFRKKEPPPKLSISKQTAELIEGHARRLGTTPREVLDALVTPAALMGLGRRRAA